MAKSEEYGQFKTPTTKASLNFDVLESELEKVNREMTRSIFYKKGRAESLNVKGLKAPPPKPLSGVALKAETAWDIHDKRGLLEKDGDDHPPRSTGKSLSKERTGTSSQSHSQKTTEWLRAYSTAPSRRTSVSPPRQREEDRLKILSLKKENHTLKLRLQESARLLEEEKARCAKWKKRGKEIAVSKMEVKKRPNARTDSVAHHSLTFGPFYGRFSKSGKLVGDISSTISHSLGGEWETAAQAIITKLPHPLRGANMAGWKSVKFSKEIPKKAVQQYLVGLLQNPLSHEDTRRAAVYSRDKDSSDED